MRALSKTFLVLLAATGLASCGGGGGGSQGAFEPTPADSISVSAASSSISTSSFTVLTVTVTKHDGSAENDGTTINASVSPATIGTVSGGAGSSGTTATNTLTGGKTTFNFGSSNQAGTAVVTISVPAGTNGATSVGTATSSITVTAGNTQDPRLVFVPQSSTTLPLSPYSIGQQLTSPFPGNYPGSPFIAELALTFRHTNGQLVAGSTTVNISSSNPTVAGISTLDNPATPWTGKTATPPDDTGNEFLTIIGSGGVPVTAGVGTVYVHGGNVAGSTVITATAIDPDTNQAITSQITITVAGSATTLPSSISASSSGAAYISGSNGPQSTLVFAQVSDGNGASVADPVGFDNVQFSISGPANSDAKLVGLNAAGGAVSGTTIATGTHNGIASVTLQSGSQQGPVQVTVTADRGDNNVDNGIQDGVTATVTVIVSDGKLFSLTLSTPAINAILANDVSNQTTLTSQGSGANLTVPPAPDATYSFTVSAIGVDRQGNPVLPGTVVNFGSIDAPQANGQFLISGTQGDPQEGGTLFTALDGHFTTAGGGAGPGDTLLVFGKDVPGNSDLESASKVARINSATSLNVSTPFNLNDTTGAPVDNGPVLPYIIGRAQTGNISTPSTTNAFGVATTTLNYPVSQLGRTVAIWAQSTSTDVFTHGSNIVTDAAVLVYPGIADAKIVVSPNPIPGNLTTEVDACIYDALNSPIQGVHFQFGFTNLGVGSGSVDGLSSAGVVPDATDSSGCVATLVKTSGIASSGGTGTGTGTTAPGLTFTAGSASTTTPIVASGGLILLATPSSLGGNGGTVILTLLNSNGTPVPGVQLTGTCTGDASIGIFAGPGVTGSDGKTTAQISAQLNQIGSAGTGSCKFTTATGTPTATVNLLGTDLCLSNTSPTPITGCTNTTPPTTATVNLTISSSPAGSASISSSPAGIDCQLTTGTSQTCPVDVPAVATSYTLTATLGTGTTFGGWSGSCVQQSGTPPKAKLNITATTTSASCTLLVHGP